MTCLVLVEGELDESFVHGLAEGLGVKVRILRMIDNRPERVARIIEAGLASRNYSKVIVLKDRRSSGKDRVLIDSNLLSGN